MSTELLSLDEIVASQSGKEATHNTALRQIEGRMVRAKSRTTINEPGSPTAGDTYILTANASGTDWTGNDGKIGHYYGGAWEFYTPIEGVSLWVNDENLRVTYDSADWIGPRNPIFRVNVSTASITLTIPESEHDIFQILGSTVASSIVLYVASGIEKQWTIFNNSSGGANTVTINMAGATATASGVIVGDFKSCIVYANSSTVQRITADSSIV